MQPIATARKLYNENNFVKFCTNWTAILGFVGLIAAGGVQAHQWIDAYFAKAIDVRVLQQGQDAVQKEQKEQRQILDKQSRQLDFMYYDSLKRDKLNLEREIFDLRSKSNRTFNETARLHQLEDDLKDINTRLREQEDIMRGRTR